MQPLRDRAQGRWRDILTALGIERHYLTGKHTACPICRAGKDRFRFDDKDGRGTWICSTCEEAGDGASLVMKVKGLDYKGAAELIETVIGKARYERPQQRSRTDDRSRAAMNALWKAGAPVQKGDPVALWLERRGIRLKDYPASLRFVENARYQEGEHGPASEHPAMIAMVCGPDGRPEMLHRTFLTWQGEKAQVESPRKMMAGDVPKGSAVRLLKPTETLGIAEGIETALAAAQLFDVPCWAALNTSLMTDWTPPEGVKRVRVFGDNDAKFAGQATAFSLARKLAGKGYEVEVSVPPLIGQDWNDVLRADLVRM